MISALARMALGLSMVTHTFAQDRYFSEIPAAEATALSQVVEDTPPPPSQRKGEKWISPEYTLIYKNPLPVPEVKQPKQ